MDHFDVVIIINDRNLEVVEAISCTVDSCHFLITEIMEESHQ